ncbi:hypothetical protein DFH07DRAFT_130946 [Mycena maculata]|uniref:F-box domain-containing protein n=1 Tax=Mycena maculata TaxID=230809 RepID=A0AAD7MV44_9AGAR|nr:hypothetical protein DFH07DRAFT_130946 [Mycena maculata]
MAGTDRENIQNLIEAKKIKISRLASQIQDLTLLREAEIRELATLQMMISPIGKLPTELLAEVFHHHVPIERLSTWAEDNTDEIVQAALHISQVCHSWREIAHDIPGLWVDGFRFDIDKEYTERQLAQTKTWLERSHPLPITIYFHGFSEPGCILPEILLSSTRRWRNLIWDVPFLEPLTKLGPGSLEALEIFTMDAQSFRHGPPDGAVDAFLLSQLRIFEIAIPLNDDVHMHSIFHVPWSQLTSLRMHNVTSLNDCCQMLVQCISVVSVDLYTREWTFPDSAPPVVVLPFLETLKMDFSCFNPGNIARVDPFFSALSLPSLKTLDLTFEIGDVEFIWDTQKFSEFQDRSPVVQKIQLNCDDEMDTDSLLTLLRHSPSITELKINCELDDAFMHGLQCIHNGPSPFVPNLQRLTLRNMGSQPSDSAVEAMVRSRWWTGSAIPFPGVSHLQSPLTLTRGPHMSIQGIKTRLADLGIYMHRGY